MEEDGFDVLLSLLSPLYPFRGDCHPPLRNFPNKEPLKKCGKTFHVMKCAFKRTQKFYIITVGSRIKVKMSTHNLNAENM